MENKYDQTIATWNNISAEYEARFMQLDIYNETYNFFSDLLADDATLLETSCGPGNITAYLLKQKPGLSILATDTSPNMLELAKKNVPEAQFELRDLRNIAMPGRTFDGIVCGFGIPYLTREDCGKLFADFRELLIPGGVLYLSYIPGERLEPEFYDGLSGGMHFYYHSNTFISELFRTYGFTMLKTFDIPYTTKDGLKQVHRVAVAQRR